MAEPTDPLSAPRVALDAIGLLPDAEIDIADAALHLARIDAADADWRESRGLLSEIARDAASLAVRLGKRRDPELRTDTLAGLIAGKYGLRGDVETYDDLANANLIRVLQRRKGLPVALGVIWLHAARAAAWDAHGIDFPGHFLIALEGAGGKVVVDVFDGGTRLEARAVRALIKRTEGETAELRPGILRPMSVRAVLLRLQHNIKSRRLAGGDLVGALRCCEDMSRIAPGRASLWRECGIMHERLGHIQAALRCFDRFLALVPEDDRAAAHARAVCEGLRARLN